MFFASSAAVGAVMVVFALYLFGYLKFAFLWLFSIILTALLIYFFNIHIIALTLIFGFFIILFTQSVKRRV